MSRAPVETGTARMGPLARLPAFFALQGKRAVVAGDGQGATWKAELLSAAGARVDVFAPAPQDGLRALAGAPPAGAVIIHERAWTAGRPRRRGPCDRRVRRRCGSRFVRGRRPQSRRAGQCHRPSGVLRFRVRRHRQPLAARHRHIHRRRRAGVRPGDPRKDRGFDSEGFRTLGRCRAQMASARAGARAVVPRPPEFLGNLYRARHRGARSGADQRRPRSRCSSRPARQTRAPSCWSAPAPATRSF